MPYNNTATPITAPIVLGMTFEGWYTTPARTAQTVFTNVTSDRNAYAKYGIEVKGETWNDLTQETWEDFPDTDTWEDI